MLEVVVCSRVTEIKVSHVEMHFGGKSREPDKSNPGADASEMKTHLNTLIFKCF